MNLTLNVLLSLIIQAKRTGKGKTGNGRMLIMLLQIIADTAYPELSAERSLLRIFSNEPVKSKAYQSIDKQLVKFIPKGKPYPYEKLSFNQFAQSIGNIQRYSEYLLRFHQCCGELLDPEKTESLVYTILDILRTDIAITDILYGAHFMPKEALFGTPAHPKKLCLAALLLGLLYQTHQIPNRCGETVPLMKAPLLLQFHLINPTGSYRNRTRSLHELLTPDAPVTLEQSIFDTASKRNSCSDEKEIYPVELCDEHGNAAVIPDHGHIFLYGTGGSGKTTLLSRLHTGNTGFMLPLFQYRLCTIPAYQPDGSCWILLQILLKYHYQDCCRTYDACAAEEGTDTVLRQLHELENLLSVQPVNGQPNYTLMLDGINEVPPDYKSELLTEIDQICHTWCNVRLIVTGRNIPPDPLFHCFHKIELCGISDDALDNLLPIHSAHRDLLKTPLFLNIYTATNQERISLNRAFLLDAYVNRLIDAVHDKSLQPLLRFLVLYVLPVAANLMVQNQRMFMERADLSDAIDRTIDIFINDERIYQNILFPQQITKKSLHFSSDKDELIDFLISQICLLQTDAADTKILFFSHQYFRDFFAAKYIENMLNSLYWGYANTPEQLAYLFQEYGLGHLWYPEEMQDIYRLIGELTGDDCNQAEDDFISQATILDTALDWSRQFDTFRLTENVIRTMASVRNNIICGVNFSETVLPPYLPCKMKFSLNGEYACDFARCQVQLIGLIDGNVCCMAQSPDGTKILLALEDQYVILLDAESKYILHEYDFSDRTFPYCEFDLAAFSPDNRFVSLLTDHAAVLLNADTGAIVYQYFSNQEHGIIEFAAFSIDSRYWAVKIHDRITLLDLYNDNEMQSALPLINYKITISDENMVMYSEKKPLSSLNSAFLKTLYRNLPHFRGCDFTDAVFLSEDTKFFLRELGAEINPK